MDRVTPLLLEALKQALAEPQEQRLFRSGKLAGLFRSRVGVSAAAAQRAVQEGLLEVTRTEPGGKLDIEWVHATPRAVDFVHSHEAPAAALKELHAALDTTQQNLPAWLGELRQRLDDLTHQLTSEVQAMGRRLQQLSQRAAEAIDRLESAGPQVSEKMADLVPWANDVLHYLERRNQSGVEGPCPLSELFSALRVNHPELTVTEYHIGLRRLFDRGIVRLLPFEGTDGLPEPEYALLDGMNTYYFVTRAGK